MRASKKKLRFEILRSESLRHYVTTNYYYYYYYLLYSYTAGHHKFSMILFIWTLPRQNVKTISRVYTITHRSNTRPYGSVHPYDVGERPNPEE